MEVASAILSIIPALTKTLGALEDLLRSSSGIQKFEIWHRQWLGQQGQPDASYKALWGTEGWVNVQSMLQEVLRISQQIDRACESFQGRTDSRPRSRWKQAMGRLKLVGEPSLNHLRKLIQDFNLTVDATWLYSETVFDSLHGVFATSLGLPSRDRLVTSAIHSRSKSMKLYELCCKGSTDCLLDLDLRPDVKHESGIAGEEKLASLSYRLFAQDQNNSKQLQSLFIQIPSESGNLRTHGSEVLDTKNHAFQLFESRLSGKGITIPVDHERAGPNTCLWIESATPSTRRMASELDTLAVMMKRLKGMDPLTLEEHFPVDDKIKVAFQIVESGIFLLGTPWFSLLNSQNPLRLQNGKWKEKMCVIRTLALGIADLLFDDTEALSETKQLFQIGVLLMEIALDGPVVRPNPTDPLHLIDLLSQLPRVEKALGSQYCKATAFCLQHRQPNQLFNGPGKYSSHESEDWKQYLSDLLQEYHAQVYIRLEELRAIDADSAHTSRRSSLNKGN